MSEFENRSFWDEGKATKLMEDVVKVPNLVKRGIILVEDGVIRKVELFMSSGEVVKGEAQKVIKLQGLVTDLVKSLESAREKGIGI